jgi:hypothetical protein
MPTNNNNLKAALLPGETSINTKVESEIAMAKEYANGSLASSLYIALASVIITLVIIILIYYTLFTLFDLTGILGASDWASSAHGLLIYVGAFLAIVGASSCIAYMFTSNSTSFAAAIFASVVLAILFYLTLRTLGDNAKISFWAFMIVFVLVSLVGAGYSVYSVMSMSKAYAYTPAELALMTDDEKKMAIAESASYGSRKTWSYVMMGVTVVGLILYGAAAVKLSAVLV